MLSFCLIVFFFYSSLGVAQNLKAFLLRFEHQTPAPLQFPNYFKNKFFADSVLQITEQWAKENFAVSSLDHKIKEPISYNITRSAFWIDRSIEFTNYDFVVQIISFIEEPHNNKRNQPESAMIFQVLVRDKKDRVVFESKEKSILHILPSDESVGEALIGEADFQKMYFTALLAVFKKAERARVFWFKQPMGDEISDFVKNSFKAKLQKTGREKLVLVEDSLSNEFNFQMKPSYQIDDGYYRECILKHPGDGREYLLRAELKKESPDFFYIEMIYNKQNFGKLAGVKGEEQTTLRSKQDELDLIFSRHLGSDFIKLEKGNTVIAMLVKDKSKSAGENYEEYTVYFNTYFKKPEKTMLIHFLAAEVLMNALHKFYTLENTKKQ